MSSNPGTSPTINIRVRATAENLRTVMGETIAYANEINKAFGTEVKVSAEVAESVEVLTRGMRGLNRAEGDNRHVTMAVVDGLGIFGNELGHLASKAYYLKEGVSELTKQFGGLKGAILPGIGISLGFQLLAMIPRMVEGVEAVQKAKIRMSEAGKYYAQAFGGQASQWEDAGNKAAEAFSNAFLKYGVTRPIAQDIIAQGMQHHIKLPDIIAHQGTIVDVAKRLAGTDLGTPQAVMEKLTSGQRGLNAIMREAGLNLIPTETAALQKGIDPTKKFDLALTILARHFGGYAAENAKTFAGAMANLHYIMSEFYERAGVPVVNILTKLVQGMIYLATAANWVAGVFSKHPFAGWVVGIGVFVVALAYLLRIAGATAAKIRASLITTFTGLPGMGKLFPQPPSDAEIARGAKGWNKLTGLPVPKDLKKQLLNQQAEVAVRRAAGSMSAAELERLVKWLHLFPDGLIKSAELKLTLPDPKSLPQKAQLEALVAALQGGDLARHLTLTMEVPDRELMRAATDLGKQMVGLAAITNVERDLKLTLEQPPLEEIKAATAFSNVFSKISSGVKTAGIKLEFPGGSAAQFKELLTDLKALRGIKALGTTVTFDAKDATIAKDAYKDNLRSLFDLNKAEGGKLSTVVSVLVPVEAPEALDRLRNALVGLPDLLQAALVPIQALAAALREIAREWVITLRVQGADLGALRTTLADLGAVSGTVTVGGGPAAASPQAEPRSGSWLERLRTRFFGRGVTSTAAAEEAEAAGEAPAEEVAAEAPAPEAAAAPEVPVTPAPEPLSAVPVSEVVPEVVPAAPTLPVSEPESVPVVPEPVLTPPTKPEASAAPPPVPYVGGPIVTQPYIPLPPTGFQRISKQPPPRSTLAAEEELRRLSGEHATLQQTRTDLEGAVTGSAPRVAALARLRKRTPEEHQELSDLLRQQQSYNQAIQDARARGESMRTLMAQHGWDSAAAERVLAGEAPHPEGVPAPLPVSYAQLSKEGMGGKTFHRGRYTRESFLPTTPGEAEPGASFFEAELSKPGRPPSGADAAKMPRADLIKRIDDMVALIAQYQEVRAQADALIASGAVTGKAADNLKKQADKALPSIPVATPGTPLSLAALDPEKTGLPGALRNIQDAALEAMPARGQQVPPQFLSKGRISALAGPMGLTLAQAHAQARAGTLPPVFRAPKGAGLLTTDVAQAYNTALTTSKLGSVMNITTEHQAMPAQSGDVKRELDQARASISTLEELRRQPFLQGSDAVLTHIQKQLDGYTRFAEGRAQELARLTGDWTERAEQWKAAAEVEQRAAAALPPVPTAPLLGGATAVPAGTFTPAAATQMAQEARSAPAAGWQQQRDRLADQLGELRPHQAAYRTIQEQLGTGRELVASKKMVAEDLGPLRVEEGKLRELLQELLEAKAELEARLAGLPADLGAVEAPPVGEPLRTTLAEQETPFPKLSTAEVAAPPDTYKSLAPAQPTEPGAAWVPTTKHLTRMRQLVATRFGALPEAMQRLMRAQGMQITVHPGENLSEAVAAGTLPMPEGETAQSLQGEGGGTPKAGLTYTSGENAGRIHLMSRTSAAVQTEEFMHALDVAMGQAMGGGLASERPEVQQAFAASRATPSRPLGEAALENPREYFAQSLQRYHSGEGGRQALHQTDFAAYQMAQRQTELAEQLVSQGAAPLEAPPPGDLTTGPTPTEPVKPTPIPPHPRTIYANQGLDRDARYMAQRFFSEQGTPDYLPDVFGQGGKTKFTYKELWAELKKRVKTLPSGEKPTMKRLKDIYAQMQGGLGSGPAVVTHGPVASDYALVGNTQDRAKRRIEKLSERLDPYDEAARKWEEQYGSGATEPTEPVKPTESGPGPLVPTGQPTPRFGRDYISTQPLRTAAGTPLDTAIGGALGGTRAARADILRKLRIMRDQLADVATPVAAHPALREKISSWMTEHGITEEELASAGEEGKAPNQNAGAAVQQAADEVARLTQRQKGLNEGIERIKKALTTLLQTEEKMRKAINSGKVQLDAERTAYESAVAEFNAALGKQAARVNVAELEEQFVDEPRSAGFRKEVTGRTNQALGARQQRLSAVEQQLGVAQSTYEEARAAHKEAQSQGQSFGSGGLTRARGDITTGTGKAALFAVERISESVSEGLATKPGPGSALHVFGSVNATQTAFDALAKQVTTLHAAATHPGLAQVPEEMHLAARTSIREVNALEAALQEVRERTEEHLALGINTTGANAAIDHLLRQLVRMRELLASIPVSGASGAAAPPTPTETVASALSGTVVPPSGEAEPVGGEALAAAMSPTERAGIIGGIIGTPPPTAAPPPEEPPAAAAAPVVPPRPPFSPGPGATSAADLRSSFQALPAGLGSEALQALGQLERAATDLGLSLQDLAALVQRLSPGLRTDLMQDEHFVRPLSEVTTDLGGPDALARLQPFLTQTGLARPTTAEGQPALATHGATANVYEAVTTRLTGLTTPAVLAMEPPTVPSTAAGAVPPVVPPAPPPAPPAAAAEALPPERAAALSQLAGAFSGVIAQHTAPPVETEATFGVDGNSAAAADAWLAKLHEIMLAHNIITEAQLDYVSSRGLDNARFWARTLNNLPRDIVTRIWVELQPVMPPLMMLGGKKGGKLSIIPPPDTIAFVHLKEDIAVNAAARTALLRDEETPKNIAVEETLGVIAAQRNALRRDEENKPVTVKEDIVPDKAGEKILAADATPRTASVRQGVGQFITSPFQGMGQMFVYMTIQGAVWDAMSKVDLGKAFTGAWNNIFGTHQGKKKGDDVTVNDLMEKQTTRIVDAINNPNLHRNVTLVGSADYSGGARPTANWFDLAKHATNAEMKARLIDLNKGYIADAKKKGLGDISRYEPLDLSPKAIKYARTHIFKPHTSEDEIAKQRQTAYQGYKDLVNVAASGMFPAANQELSAGTDPWSVFLKGHPGALMPGVDPRHQFAQMPGVKEAPVPKPLSLGVIVKNVADIAKAFKNALAGVNWGQAIGFALTMVASEIASAVVINLLARVPGIGRFFGGGGPKQPKQPKDGTTGEGGSGSTKKLSFKDLENKYGTHTADEANTRLKKIRAKKAAHETVTPEEEAIDAASKAGDYSWAEPGAKPLVPAGGSGKTGKTGQGGAQAEPSTGPSAVADLPVVTPAEKAEVTRRLTMTKAHGAYEQAVARDAPESELAPLREADKAATLAAGETWNADIRDRAVPKTKATVAPPAQPKLDLNKPESFGGATPEQRAAAIHAAQLEHVKLEAEIGKLSHGSTANLRAHGAQLTKLHDRARTLELREAQLRFAGSMQDFEAGGMTPEQARIAAIKEQILGKGPKSGKGLMVTKENIAKVAMPGSSDAQVEAVIKDLTTEGVLRPVSPKQAMRTGVYEVTRPTSGHTQRLGRAARTAANVVRRGGRAGATSALPPEAPPGTIEVPPEEMTSFHMGAGGVEVPGIIGTAIDIGMIIGQAAMPLYETWKKDNPKGNVFDFLRDQGRKEYYDPKTKQVYLLPHGKKPPKGWMLARREQWGGLFSHGAQYQDKHGWHALPGAPQRNPEERLRILGERERRAGILSRPTIGLAGLEAITMPGAKQSIYGEMLDDQGNLLPQYDTSKIRAQLGLPPKQPKRPRVTPRRTSSVRRTRARATPRAATISGIPASVTIQTPDGPATLRDPNLLRLYHQASVESGMPMAALVASGYKESGWQTGIVQKLPPGTPESQRGYGVAQFTGDTGAYYLGGKGWQQRALDPTLAIPAAGRMFKDLLRQNHGNVKAALAAYNAGNAASPAGQRYAATVLNMASTATGAGQLPVAPPGSGKTQPPLIGPQTQQVPIKIKVGPVTFDASAMKAALHYVDTHFSGALRAQLESAVHKAFGDTKWRPGVAAATGHANAATSSLATSSGQNLQQKTSTAFSKAILSSFFGIPFDQGQRNAQGPGKTSTTTLAGVVGTNFTRKTTTALNNATFTSFLGIPWDTAQSRTQPGGKKATQHLATAIGDHLHDKARPALNNATHQSFVQIDWTTPTNKTITLSDPPITTAAQAIGDNWSTKVHSAFTTGPLWVQIAADVVNTISGMLNTIWSTVGGIIGSIFGHKKRPDAPAHFHWGKDGKLQPDPVPVAPPPPVHHPTAHPTHRVYTPAMLANLAKTVIARDTAKHFSSTRIEADVVRTLQQADRNAHLIASNVVNNHGNVHTYAPGSHSPTNVHIDNVTVHTTSAHPHDIYVEFMSKTIAGVRGRAGGR